MTTQPDFDFQLGSVIHLSGAGWFGLAALVLVLTAALAILALGHRSGGGQEP